MAQSGFERALSWGLLASPLALSFITALSKTPAGDYPHAQELFYLPWLLGCVLACGGGLVCARWRGTKFKRVATAVLSAVFEAAWVALYLTPLGKTATGVAGCTLLTAASIVGLAQLWSVTGRQPTVRGELLRASIALLGGFVLYAFMTVLWEPLVASFAYPVVTGALLMVGIAREESDTPPSSAALPALRPNVGLLVFGSLLCVVLGISISLVCRSVPQEGTYNGLGLAFIALALPAVAGSRLPAVGPALFVGPLAVAAPCLELLEVPGTSAACLLAAMLVLVLCPLLSKGELVGELGPVWQKPAATLLFLEALGLLCGFALDRFVLTDVFGVSWGVRLAVVVILASAMDACWRVALSRSGTGSREWLEETVASTSRSSEIARLADRYRLSPREAQVAELLGENRSLNFICKVLELAPSTVKTHAGHIYEKTGTHGKDELQLLMREFGDDETEGTSGPRG